MVEMIREVEVRAIRLRWEPLPEGILKVNVDVAFNPSNRLLSSEVVLRDF